MSLAAEYEGRDAFTGQELKLWVWPDGTAQIAERDINTRGWLPPVELTRVPIKAAPAGFQPSSALDGGC